MGAGFWSKQAGDTPVSTCTYTGPFWTGFVTPDVDPFMELMYSLINVASFRSKFVLPQSKNVPVMF